MAKIKKYNIKAGKKLSNSLNKNSGSVTKRVAKKKKTSGKKAAA